MSTAYVADSPLVSKKSLETISHGVVGNDSDTAKALTKEKTLTG